jgi:hypothetical protein
VPCAPRSTVKRQQPIELRQAPSLRGSPHCSNHDQLNNTVPATPAGSSLKLADSDPVSDPVRNTRGQKQTRPETDAARAGLGKNSFPGPRRLSPGKLETGSRHPSHPSALESPAFTQPNRAHRPSHHTKTKRFQHKSKDTRAPRVGQRLCVNASTGGKLNTNHSVRNNTARSQGARKSTEWEAGETRPHPATNRHLRPVRSLTDPAAPDQTKSH